LYLLISFLKTATATATNMASAAVKAAYLQHSMASAALKGLAATTTTVSGGAGGGGGVVTTSAAAGSIPKLRYLSAWFCPYAHRATLALEHHAGRVDYEWVEALGWNQQKDEHDVTGTGQEWFYHWKADELKRVNPSALVPTLIPVTDRARATDVDTDVDTDTDVDVVDESKAVFESLVTIDYVDAVSGATGKDRLVSEDPYEAARSRIWTDRVNRDCCSPY
jgi:glutathione S-transferase